MIEVCSSLQAEVGQQEYADGDWSQGEECIHCFDAGWLVADGIRLFATGRFTRTWRTVAVRHMGGESRNESVALNTLHCILEKRLESRR